MSLISDYTGCVLDQEIDTLEISPEYPEYMIVGTYSLVKATEIDTTTQSHEDQTDGSQATASRVGSLRVLPINNISQSDLEGHSPYLDRLDFPCAILDIRFCPSDKSLLGATTSIGELRFFRIRGLLGESDHHLESIRIVPLGIAQVSTGSDNDGTSAPLITQFTWIQDKRPSTSNSGFSETSTHRLAVCDTTGQTKLVQVSVPHFSSTNDIKHNPTNNELNFTTENIHKHLHDLEAWTINLITISTDSDELRQILLSGGDDSCLIASTYIISVDDQTSGYIALKDAPARVHIDKRNHTAGVVSILPLPPVRNRELDNAQSITTPLLTGSYDQRIRLFLFDSTTLRFTLTSEFELEGGVWRIALLDTYSTSVTQEHQMQQQHHVLLVSVMHSGSYIVRLIHQFSTDDSESGSWTWLIEARFTLPHESMVYACAARKVASGNEDNQMWQVVSTSFYDKRICVWNWTDQMKGP